MNDRSYLENRGADDWSAAAIWPGERLAVAGARLAWLGTWLTVLVLILRFALKLFAADPASRLAGAVYEISFPLIAPFLGTVPTPEFGPVVLEGFTLIAIAGYLLLGTAIAKFCAIFGPLPGD